MLDETRVDEHAVELARFRSPRAGDGETALARHNDHDIEGPEHRTNFHTRFGWSLAHWSVPKAKGSPTSVNGKFRPCFCTASERNWQGGRQGQAESHHHLDCCDAYPTSELGH